MTEYDLLCLFNKILLLSERKYGNRLKNMYAWFENVEDYKTMKIIS